ncbi:hypothetical protein, partial [Umezakia ovalisporum]|uniref:hypothetical protein n=1 Tax=Umezakia ovalisporum TaxID=75695 RepID=UPI0039C6AA44
PLEQGDINLAEVRAIGVISDAVNYSATLESNIKDSWFRNLKTAFVFRNSTLADLAIGCNYFQNIHTGVDLTSNSSFGNPLGTASAPCGNRFTWYDAYFGLPNVAPNDCKILVTMNNVTNQTYFRFTNENPAISYGNLLIGNGPNPGIPQNQTNQSCPNAVRDPFSQRVKPIDKPIVPDPIQMGFYNLMGLKVGDVNFPEENLPLGIYLKVDEKGKKIIRR